MAARQRFSGGSRTGQPTVLVHGARLQSKLAKAQQGRRTDAMTTQAAAGQCGGDEGEAAAAASRMCSGRGFGSHPRNGDPDATAVLEPRVSCLGRLFHVER